MRTLKKKILLIVVIAVLTNCGGNGGGPAPAVDQVQATIDGLSKTWNVSGVTLDGSSVSNDWSGVSISFTANKSFEVSGLSTENSLIWPSTGTYSFPDSTKPMSILRSDGIEIGIINLTENTATLDFTIFGRTGGRVVGLSGNYSFSFRN